jgi:hypothetical protein
MAMNKNWGAAGAGGGFFPILGIIYLIKVIRKRREQRRIRNAPGPVGT